MIQRGKAPLCAIALTVLVGNAAAAQPTPACQDGRCVVAYEATFFGRYAPVTALDMVENLPGFILDDGDQSRGFAGSAGNILIDGERISSKSETPSEVLSRIPAAQVAHIEVIRGQTGGTDLRGQSVIANVVRTPGGVSGAWTAGASAFPPEDALYPFGSASVAARRGKVSATLGVEAARYLRRIEADEFVIGPNGEVLEVRDEVFREDGQEALASLQAQATVGETAFRLNASFEWFDEAGGESSLRTPDGGVPFVLFQGDTDTEEAFEVGVDVERRIIGALSGKLIGLFRQADFFETGSLELRDDDVVDSRTTFNSLDTEAIARLELDYNGITGHVLEASIEGAVNRLESAFSLRVNEDGVLTPQDVPGANTEVEEQRVDASLSDSFAIGPIAIDAILAGEASTITQTGGFADERSFTFFKPSLTLTYSPTRKTQLRALARREVGQLNFFDFVSAADLGDNELALGNPDLAPETTLAFETSLERRFGDLGVVTVTGFHDEISDVQDLLPLEGVLEVPGNIGDGRRSGLRAEATLPLEPLGFASARLDVTGSWQTSSVADPLTGQGRRLSNERRWEGNVAFRQDLTAWKFAWGGDVSFFDDAPQFGLDEIDVTQEGVDLDAFAETRALRGLRIRLGVENVLEAGQERDRQVFAGARNVADLAFIERRDRSSAREVFVEVSGAF